ncbi:MAG TPA: hypothetical protein VKB35_16935, partial [Ktedonobacteraceae bacterium]|nr:hypothetical protein [Ktedonobacteraceae bacterium]
QEAIRKVVDILAYLESGDFSLRLMRWAGTWGEDEHAMELRVLASEAVNRPGLLTDDLLNWLISDEAVLNWSFFQALGECDLDHCWLSRVERMGVTKKGVFAFSAYFAGLSVVDVSFVNCRLNELTEEGVIRGEAIARATVNLPGDLTGVERVKKLWNDKKVDIATIEF